MFSDSNRSWLVYCLSVIAVLALLVLVTVLLSRVAVSPVQLSDYNSYRCEVVSQATGKAIDQKIDSSGSNQDNEFHILTLTPISARRIADGLCARSERFGINAVRISWHARGHLTARDIVVGKYDLFWNRLHLVEGMVPTHQDYYAKVFDTPTYPLYWVAVDKKPVANEHYFNSHRVGLLDDPHSQTMFLQPHDWLQKHGIKLLPENSRFYSDIASLEEAFLSREIDVMSMSDTMIDLLGIKKAHRLLINDAVESGSWFLHTRWNDPGLSCLVNNLIIEQESAFDVSLYKKVRKSPACDYSL